MQYDLPEQQKHHTGRNATYKDHINGIKKAPNHKYKSMKGVRLSWLTAVFVCLFDGCILFSCKDVSILTAVFRSQASTAAIEEGRV